MKKIVFYAVLFLTISGCSYISNNMKTTNEDVFWKPPYYKITEDIDSKNISCFNISFDEVILEFFDDISENENATSFLSELDNYLKDLCNNELKKKEGNNSSFPKLYIGSLESPFLDYYGSVGNHVRSKGIGEEDQAIIIYYEEPSKLFKDANMSQTQGYYLVVYFGISEYYPIQKGLGFKKEIFLGKDNKIDVPWHTGLNKPVEVCQFKALLMDPNGKVINAGAEGIYALKNSFTMQLFDIQNSFNEDIFEVVLNHKIQVNGVEKLAWKHALESLLDKLI